MSNADLLAAARKESDWEMELGSTALARLLDRLADALEAAARERDAALTVIADAKAKHRTLSDADYVADEMLAILTKATS